MINVFIPHRWNNNDYAEISVLLDRTKYKVRDYSVPNSSPFDSIDRRYNVDPQIKRQIRYASVVVCSNRPANNLGMSIEEIRFATPLLSNSNMLLKRRLNIPIPQKNQL